MTEHLWTYLAILGPILGGLGSLFLYLWKVVKDHCDKFDRIEKASKKSLAKMRKWEPFLRHLAPNGGKSLFDAIARLEQGQQAIQDQIAINNYLKRTIMPESPSFEADRSGKWTWTNHSLDTLCGVQEGDLHGNAWIRAIQADLREEAQVEWMRSIRAGVPYYWESTIVNEVTVEAVAVTLRAVPISNYRNEVVGYFGSVARRV